MIIKKVKKDVLLCMVALLSVGGLIFGLKNTSNASISGIADYRDFELSTVRNNVTDEAIEETLRTTVDDAGGNYISVAPDEELLDGYKLNVSYYEEGLEDDAQFMEYKKGDKIYPEEFAEALNKMKIGDNTEVELFLEEHEHPNGEVVKNENTKYYLTVTSAEKPSYDIDDEYVSSLKINNVSTVDELKESISEYLESSYDKVYEDELKEEIRKNIVENSTLKKDVSGDLLYAYVKDINLELDAIINYYIQQGEEDVTKETVLSPYMEESKFTGSVDDYIEADAVKKANECLIFEKIAKKEGLEVTEEEFYHLVSEKLKANGVADPAFSEIEEYIAKIGKDNLKLMLSEEKVLDMLYDFYK